MAMIHFNTCVRIGFVYLKAANNGKVPYDSVILSSKSHINNTTKNANRVFIFLFIWRPQCHKSAAGFIITGVVKHVKCGEKRSGKSNENETAGVLKKKKM